MHQATLYAGMTTLTRGALAEVIAELHHERRDAGQDPLDFGCMPLLPLALLRGALDDARRARVERSATAPYRVVEGQRESLEDVPEQLHRSLEQILVAHPDPLRGRHALERVQGEAVGRRPLEGADLLERRVVVVAPARRK